MITLFSRVRKLSICMPLKTGCTTITRMWLAINNRDINYLNYTLGKDISGKYNSGQIGKQYPQTNDHSFDKLNMNSYPWVKLISIRHPFERLYSGWKDKFGGNRKKGPYFRNYYDKVSKYNATRDHKQDYKPGQAPIIGFEQWLLYMADNSWLPINDHFKPIGFFCSPCEVDFDYVLENENLGETLVEAFNYTTSQENLTWHPEIGINDKTFFKEVLKQAELGKLAALNPYKLNKRLHHPFTAKQIFRDISSRNKTLIDVIYKKYEWDFKLFGYDANEYYAKDIQ